jgi:hypothetical protein
MMETFTINQDSFFNEGKQEEAIMTTLDQRELDFYESIKPALKALVKNPSDETVNKILAFSKAH